MHGRIGQFEHKPQMFQGSSIAIASGYSGIRLLERMISAVGREQVGGRKRLMKKGRFGREGSLTVPDVSTMSG